MGSHKTDINVFLEVNMVPHELITSSSIHFGLLSTNPVLYLLFDFAVSHKTVINVFLKVNMVPNEVKTGSNSSHNSFNN